LKKPSKLEKSLENMTLINSCWPKSFSHLIFLLSTFTITATTIPTDHLAASRQRTAGDATTTIFGYDRKNDNKRYDNLFDFKTDVNNLLFHSHGNLQPSTISRKRRDTIVPTMKTATAFTPTPSTTANLISTVETNVSSLNLSFANLTTFSTSIGDSFALLNLSHNFLSSFNASKLMKLKALDLSHNNLSEFNLEGHALLQSLDVSLNSLTTFKCIHCESLKSLNLSKNLLTKVALENSNSIKLIDLSANELSDIDPHLFHNKSNLSDVILACNRIRAIRKDLFQQLKSLRRLDLSYNDISDIEDGTFAGMANLEIFDLSFNRIHIASLQALQSINDLARLSLAGNFMLKNALRGFAVTWSIMELDYSRVGLCQVPDSLAQSVRILNLYGNFLNVSISSKLSVYRACVQITF
jgi:Leucine-rich repeat (LRR) protein